MRKFKALLLGLTISFVTMTSVAVEQVINAQQEPNLQCIDLSNCGGSASCNSAGSVSGCTITCYGGGSISCPAAKRPTEIILE